MCGIAGILNFNDQPVEGAQLRAMTHALAHRGPDGEGIYVDGKIGLGHRRLAILDLSTAGRQPMSFADERYWITYNGEIYNFLELKSELESCSYVFRTQTDTEIILAAYDRWGPDCQLKFNGMWAFAIWDHREQTLFLSRDRFGIKPLYYLPEQRRFAFASEMKAFLHLHDFTARENETALRRVLTDTFSVEGTEETLLEGVKRLVGGHCMSVNSGGLKVWRWWNTLDHLTEVPRTLAQQAEQFRELFFDACRLRLRSDVPVATCLSGGVDSSAVLCTLAEINASANGGSAFADRRTQNWQRAFVATFPDTPLDERHYAEIAIHHAGAEPRYRPMSADAALDELDQVIYDFEDISITLPAPVWAIYRELRRDGVVVSLDGHGADEMLGGYQSYTETALHATGSLLRAPMRTLDLIDTLYHMYPPDGPVLPPNRVRLAAASIASDPVMRFPVRAAHSLHYRTIKQFQRRNEATSNQSATEPYWIRSPLFSESHLAPDEESAIAALGPLNDRLYHDFHYTVLPTILRNFDRCSMAHGIEVRMPFMDWRLVCFAFSLPEESKIGGGFTKRVLRESMRGVMPEALRTRKGKIGFNSPLPDWFNGPLKRWILEQVNDQDFLQSELWDGLAIRGFVEQKFRAGDAWTWRECQLVWQFLHAHVWRQTFCKRKRV